jgi:hypothetical protein
LENVFLEIMMMMGRHVGVAFKSIYHSTWASLTLIILFSRNVYFIYLIFSRIFLLMEIKNPMKYLTIYHLLKWNPPN